MECPMYLITSITDDSGNLTAVRGQTRGSGSLGKTPADSSLLRLCRLERSFRDRHFLDNAECRRRGMSQREYSLKVALPRYAARIEGTFAQRSLAFV
jgi:hypothetical protein